MNESTRNYKERPLTNREFRALPMKQKMEYMWKYKRIHVIMYAVELVVIVAALLLLKSSNDRLLTGIVLNSADSASAEGLETLRADFQEAARKYSEKTTVEMADGIYYYLNDASKAEDNYGVIQFLVHYTEKKDLDFLTGDQETVTVLAYSGFFHDLSVVLSKEQVEQYKPYFRYIDQAVVDKIVEAAETETDVDIQIPDCSKPEDMEEPIPVMIDVSHYEDLGALYSETTEPIVFAIFDESPEIGGLRNILDLIFE